MFLSGAIYNSLTETPFPCKDNLPFKLLVSLGSRDPQNNINKAVALGWFLEPEGKLVVEPHLLEKDISIIYVYTNAHLTCITFFPRYTINQKCGKGKMMFLIDNFIQVYCI